MAKKRIFVAKKIYIISQYRNPANNNKLGGKLLDLGRPTKILAMALYGFDVSLEAANTADRERISFLLRGMLLRMRKRRRYLKTMNCMPKITSKLL